MKNLIVLAAVTLSLLSCKQENNPKQVTQDFIKAVIANDNAVASSLATDDTKANLAIIKSTAQQAPAAEDQFGLTALTETVNGTAAEVKSEAITVNLKNDGGWKVVATPQLINSIANRQEALATVKQKWEALLKEYEGRLQIAKAYVGYKKGSGALSADMKKLEDAVNALNAKTTWIKETINLYVQKQNQLKDIIDKALVPSDNANTDMSMNYFIQLSNVNDRIKAAENDYSTVVAQTPSATYPVLSAK